MAGGISASKAFCEQRSEKAAGKAAFSMRERRKRFFGFWPFATKSDIRAAEDRTRWRDSLPPTDRFNSPV
jgi:hypothetical protein